MGSKSKRDTTVVVLTPNPCTTRKNPPLTASTDPSPHGETVAVVFPSRVPIAGSQNVGVPPHALRFWESLYYITWTTTTTTTVSWCVAHERERPSRRTKWWRYPLPPNTTLPVRASAGHLCAFGRVLCLLYLFIISPGHAGAVSLHYYIIIIYYILY